MKKVSLKVGNLSKIEEHFFSKVSPRVTFLLTFGLFRSELRLAGRGPVDSIFFEQISIRILTIKG